MDSAGPKFPNCSLSRPKLSTRSASSARCTPRQQSRPAAFFMAFPCGQVAPRSARGCCMAWARIAGPAGLCRARRYGVAGRRREQLVERLHAAPVSRNALSERRAEDRESRPAGPTEGGRPAAKPVAVERAEPPASAKPSGRGRSGRPDRQLRIGSQDAIGREGSPRFVAGNRGDQANVWPRQSADEELWRRAA